MLGAALMLAAPTAQAASLAGLTGEVWFNTDLYAGLPADRRTRENILAAAETAMRARPADGTFVASALDYPQGADTMISSGAGWGTLQDFLGTDHASLVLRDGIDMPNEPLKLSLWRFTGLLMLAPNTSHDFRVSSDDGNATWMGHPAGVYPEFPDYPTMSFRTSGTFQVECCQFSFTTGDDGAVPFKMLFYERYGNTGLRMGIRETGTEDHGVLGGVLLAQGPAVGTIPLPASAWLLVSGLAGLGALGHRRRRARG